MDLVIQGYGGTVIPIHIPVLNAMDALIRVDVNSELITRASPAQLPSPVSLQLIRPGPGLYVIKAETLDVIKVL